MMFGELLRKIRREKGISQTRLAQLTGTKQASISNWELCLHEPPWSAVLSLADALGVSTEAFRDAPQERPDWNETPAANGRYSLTSGTARLTS